MGVESIRAAAPPGNKRLMVLELSSFDHNGASWNPDRGLVLENICFAVSSGRTCCVGPSSQDLAASALGPAEKMGGADPRWRCDLPWKSAEGLEQGAGERLEAQGACPGAGWRGYSVSGGG